MSAGAPLSSPAPRSSGHVVPSVAVPMPCLTLAPPAAATASDEKRPVPLMKRMTRLLARAVSWVFGGMNPTYGVALVGSLAMLVVIRVVTFTADPEEARIWLWFPLFWAWLYILMDTACWRCICYCLDFEYDQQQHQQPAEAGAAVELPPPPPEMDMC